MDLMGRANLCENNDKGFLQLFHHVSVDGGWKVKDGVSDIHDEQHNVTHFTDSPQLSPFLN